jgi:glycosyltransferase involved in cell wall biosynthesis
VSCIPTGIDLERFHFREKGTLHQELGLAPNIALVGMISVLRSWKGHATFLDAAGAYLIRNVKRSVRFVIAGDGPGRATLEEKIAQEPWKDHVTLLGHRSDVPNVLASLDALVLPSYAHEGIPQIILQAQAMSCPVIATTVGGIPEVVEDGVTGLLVPPRDSVALTEKISALLDDPKLSDRLVRSSREYVDKYHSLDTMGEQLLALYEKYRGMLPPDPNVGR